MTLFSAYFSVIVLGIHGYLQFVL